MSVVFQIRHPCRICKLTSEDGLNDSYTKLLHLDGVTISVNNNAFEITVRDTTEIWEQQAVQQLREWLKWRKKQAELREA